MGSSTRFDPEPSAMCVYLGADVLRGNNIDNNRDLLTYVAVLAHEFTHFLRQGRTLENYVLEEVATNVQAAEMLELEIEDRCDLLRCAEEILMEYRMKECS